MELGLFEMTSTAQLDWRATYLYTWRSALNDAFNENVVVIDDDDGSKATAANVMTTRKGRRNS